MARRGISEPYQALEREFAYWVGTDHAVAVNSGTSALTLAMAALGIGPGDEVIIPEFTMAACAFACLYLGAVPVPVDCGEDLNIDPAKILGKITPKTKAIMAVHIYGRVCDMSTIMAIAKKHNLRVIEDCAEAHGAIVPGGDPVGTYGDVGCFSFYRNKIIAAEEGGICVTNSEGLARRMQFLKNMAFNQEHNYLHASLGYNMRMPNAQALLALRGLRDVTDELGRRWRLACLFQKQLGDVLDFTILPRDARSVPWVFDFMPGPEMVAKILTEIPEARPFFAPMSAQPFLGMKIVDCPNATKAWNNGVYISLTKDLTLARAKTICQKILSLR